ncbi:MAG: glycosyltransferase, partial [Pyrinomonadaceae bacterium]
HVEIAANRRRGPRDMVFDDSVPTPDLDSGSFRMFMILKALAKWGRPVFVPVYQSTPREYETLLEKEGVQIVHLSEYKDVLAAGDFYAAILSRAAVADAVLPTIRKTDRNVKIIFDTVDVHFLRLEREYELTGDVKFQEEAAFRKRQEAHLAVASDQVWCVTEGDGEALRRQAPGARIKLISNIHPPRGRGRPFDEREGLLFIGNFNHRPNTDAVHYFMHKIFPRVREAIPGAKFYVVGSYMPEEIKFHGTQEGVVVLGFVPDVDSLFESSRLFVAPLRYGAGMKGKVGQALSYGLPVVTTPIGAEGMSLRRGHDVMVAGDQQAFAEMVIELYRSRELWERLSENGYKHVAEQFAPHVVEKNIHAALTALGRGERPIQAETNLNVLTEESLQIS